MLQNPDSMILVHSKACDSCRRLRVGCDRGLPHCGRCRLSKSPCTYQHRLKRESGIQRSTENDSTLHTYRTFILTHKDGLSSKPLALKWIDASVDKKEISIANPRGELKRELGTNSFPSQEKRAHKSFKGKNSKEAEIPDPSKQKAMTRFTSNQTSMKISTCLQKMFSVLIGSRFTKSTKTPLFNFSQVHKSRFLIRFSGGDELEDKDLFLIRLEEKYEISPELLMLQDAAYAAYFLYENSINMLFLGRKGFNCAPRSRFLNFAIFLSGLQYIPEVDKSLVLEILTLVTEELKLSLLRQMPCLDTIQALLILYRAYIDHMLNPLVFICLNIASILSQSLALHLEPFVSGREDALSCLHSLEKRLAYRLLISLDTNSAFALKTHPLVSDELINHKSLKPGFKTLFNKASMTQGLERCNLQLLREALLDIDTEIMTVVSNFLFQDNLVQRRLISFRSSHSSPLADLCAIEESFRSACVAYLAKLHILISRNPTISTSCGTLAQAARNFIALRLHFWVVILYSLSSNFPDRKHSPLRLTSSLKSAIRVMDHYDAFGHHPFFLCGTAFISCAMLHLKHLGRCPEATVSLPKRVISRLRQFEPVWSLSKHLQTPILQLASSLGISLD